MLKKITVLTASTIIGEAIRRIHNNESIVNSILTLKVKIEKYDIIRQII